MKTIRGNWYDYPRLYDIAFGWDPSVEVGFLEQAVRRHRRRNAHEPQRVFEPFCGTGRIAIALAQRGYRVSGLDINSAAVEFARKRCQQTGFDIDLQVGDVCDWSAPEPVDVIVVLIDSFRHLNTAEAAARAIRAFHRGLRPGGLLIMGVDVGAKPAHVTAEEHWTMERGGTVIETTVFDLRKPGSHPGASVARAILHVTEADGREYEIITDSEMRVYSLASFRSLLWENGPFEIRAVCDRHYDLDRPVTTANPDGDIVVVLQRA